LPSLASGAHDEVRAYAENEAQQSLRLVHVSPCSVRNVAPVSNHSTCRSLPCETLARTWCVIALTWRRVPRH